MSELKKKRTDVLHLPLECIEVQDGFNVRTDYGDIEALAASIIENGVKVPLRGNKVRGEDKYILTDGHRRLEAIKLAKEEHGVEMLVPFIVDSRDTSDDAKVMNMLLFNDGKPLNILEKCEAFNRLISYGYSEKDIAKKIGKSTTHVKDCLVLNKANKSLKNLVASGEVSATAVLEGLKTQTSDEVEAAVKSATVKTNAKTGKKKKVTAKAMGQKVKKFSTAVLRETYNDMKKDKEEAYDPEKLKVFLAVVKFTENSDKNYYQLQKALK